MHRTHWHAVNIFVFLYNPLLPLASVRIDDSQTQVINLIHIQVNLGTYLATLIYLC